MKNKKVLALMGGGNNGGDAACLARHILDSGGLPRVWHLKDIDSLAGSCAWHASLAIKDGVPFRKITARDMSLASFFEHGFIPDIIIDGILGTGFSGALKPELAGFITAMNSFADTIKAFTLAIDIPSGLDSTSGNPSPVSIRASATATLAAAKPGMILPKARQWTGSVYVCGIGMPRHCPRPASLRLIDGRILLNAEHLPADSYKNIYGHIVVIGGAYGMGGAAHLASAAALRAGAGLVTACAPDPSLQAVKSGWPEIMTHALGSDWPDAVPDSLQDLLERASALVIGPGMGRTRAAEKFLSALLNLPKRPGAVFDADALVILGRNPDLLAKLTDADIITPHPGEAGALLGCASRQIQEDRLASALKLAALAPSTAILKGAATLVAQRNGPVLLCPYDVPQMAIGGAGDVLAGCLGALQGLRNGGSLAAAARGVMTHVAAGLVLARKFPFRGGTASGLADALSEAETFVGSLDRSSLDAGLAPWPL